jgi:NAD+ kinase
MRNEFNKIGLWGRLSEPSVAEPAGQISAHLLQKGLTVCAALTPNEHARYPGVEPVGETALVAGVDLLVAVGGDGTLLRAARRVAGNAVPLVGINRGRLGFLTDISPDHMLDALDEILTGDYFAEERKMLEAEIVGGPHATGPMFALNDVVLQRGEPAHTMDFVTEVDGTFVNTHSGDGLIVATATGSTAYALSCGGPIMQPNVDAFVIVPIAPHTLSDRPLVLKASSVIEARVESGAEIPAYVACDGEELGRLGYTDTLRIHAADETVTMLHPRDYNYYELLRSKLHWGRANRSGSGGRTL